MQHQRKLVAIDHVPARRLAWPFTPVATERDGSSKSPITPCTRQRPARAARFSLLSADNYCSAVHGAKRLPQPPPPYWAAERLAPLLNAGMSSAPCSLPAARGHGCRRNPSCCRHAVAGGGGRRRAWTEGAVVLGRRRAPACSGGGRPGRTASETTSRGWTVFQTPSTPGALPSVRSSTSVPDRVWTLVSGLVVLVRQAQERSAARRRSGSSARHPTAVEDPGDLSGALAIRSGRRRQHD